MRILHVTDCYLPRLGGIELHLRDLATRQRAAGQDAHIVTLTPAGSGADAEDPPWVHRITGAGAGHLSATLAWTALERLIHDLAPDVVHVHVSVYSPFATMGARIASTRMLPTVVTVHSMWSHLGPLAALARSVMGLRTWPVVWSAVSSVAAVPVQRMVGPHHRVHVLPNAVEPDEWARTTPDAPHGHPGVDRALTIVSVMRLTRVKRALPLAAMLREVRAAVPDLDLSAVIIGDGPQRAPLERYLRRHGMAGWVTLAGRLDRDTIREHLDAAQIFWAPATLESFGIAPLEARTRGLPVIASSHSGVGDFITHGVDGLLGASDPAMVRHAVTLLTEPRLRAAMTQHNSRVRPRHDWELACRRNDELYELARRTAVPTPTSLLAGR